MFCLFGYDAKLRSITYSLLVVSMIFTDDCFELFPSIAKQIVLHSACQSTFCEVPNRAKPIGKQNLKYSCGHGFRYIATKITSGVNLSK